MREVFRNLLFLLGQETTRKKESSFFKAKSFVFCDQQLKCQGLVLNVRMRKALFEKKKASCAKCSVVVLNICHWPLLWVIFIISPAAFFDFDVASKSFVYYTTKLFLLLLPAAYF